MQAADTPAPAAAVAPQPPAGTGGAAAAPSKFADHHQGGDHAPLAEFNKKFREQCEAKDSAEREAKQQRRAAGKAQLKSLLGERNKVVEGRKNKNRADEAETEKAVVAAMSAEPWARVSTLIDVHGAHPGASSSKAASAAGDEHHHHGSSKKGKSGEHHDGDVSRMRDVLVGLKNTPPPVAK